MATTTFESTRFGEVEVPNETLLSFPAGMIGFPELERYSILKGKLNWISPEISTGGIASGVCAVSKTPKIAPLTFTPSKESTRTRTLLVGSPGFEKSMLDPHWVIDFGIPNRPVFASV